MTEGDLTLLFSGIIAHLGSFNFFGILVIAYVGAVTKSFLGYYIGFWLKKKYPNHKFLTFVENRVLYYLPHIKKNPFFSLLISKFLYGFFCMNYFVLFFFGFINSNFKKYIRYEMITSFIWVLIGTSLGYFFSFAALKVTHDIKKFLLIIIALVMLFFVLEKVITFIFETFENIDDNKENV
jgi:membrane protein DedA with SNARE-associated domain